MQQYNEQFMNRYMLPLLGEVVTDMGKGKNARLFGKLLDGVQMLPLEKEEFIRYYFENRQDQNRKQPFAETTPAQNKQFWGAFTDEFGKYMIMRYRLSGAEGARQAFFPGKDGGFTQVVTRNIFDLAYRITNDFERARIEQLIKKEEEAAKEAGGDAAIKAAAKAATDRGLLAEGKLKLIMVNGVEQYRSEKEIQDAAAIKDPNVKNMKVTPASAVGLGKMKDPAASAAALEVGAGISTQGGVNAVGAGTAGAAGATAGAGGAAGGTVTGAEETAGFDELQNDFAASSSAATDEKYEKLVSALADGGLTIVPNSFKNERGEWEIKVIDGNIFLTGEVKDRKGQRMKVKINPALGADKADKFEFSFISGKAPNGSPLDGMTFKVSENDLKDFNEKSAFEVAQPQLPERAKEKQGAPLPLGKPGGHGKPGFDLDLKLGAPNMEGGAPGMPKMEGKVEMPLPPTGIPSGAKVNERRPVPGAVQPGMTERPPGGLIPGRRAPISKFQKPTIGPKQVPPPEGSVAARKREAERARQEEQPGTPMPPSNRPPKPGAEEVTPGGGKKGNGMVKGAIFTTGGGLLIQAGVIAGGANAKKPVIPKVIPMIDSVSDSLIHAIPNSLAHTLAQAQTAAESLGQAVAHTLAQAHSHTIAQNTVNMAADSLGHSLSLAHNFSHIVTQAHAVLLALAPHTMTHALGHLSLAQTVINALAARFFV